MGQSKKENREKLARLRQAKQKHNTICVGHQYTQTITIDVNKTNKQPDLWVGFSGSSWSVPFKGE
jgi:hypothetical protein